MGKKITGFKTKGMNQDLSVSAFNPEFSFENINLRLSTNEGNTLLSWVNEKGTLGLGVSITVPGAQTPDEAISGYPIGTAVINHQLILFTTEYTTDSETAENTNYTDRIYKLTYDNSGTTPVITGALLYKGRLNFSTKHPLETTVSYEAEHIQKVYWVDGVNQPRVINVYNTYGIYASGTYNPFDFVPELQLGETVTVKKNLGGGGIFASGVIQYAFTYYNKHMQETNIFYTTPLLYISFVDRGASPEEKVDNTFTINISGVDGHFEYLRIYSIQRTSLNGTPICKRVHDIALTYMNGQQVAHLTSVSFTDTGTVGDTIDPTELLYKGGEVVTAGTIEQKNDTLFLGDVKLLRKKVTTSGNISIGSTRTLYPIANSSSGYIYSNQLNSYSNPEHTISVPCGGFKLGDYYRLGVQFQHKTGVWSEPVYIDDKQMTTGPTGNNTVGLGQFTGSITTGTLLNDGYKKARAVVVFPDFQTRKHLCQGVIDRTLYRNKDNTRYQSSWFFRDIADRSAVGTDALVSPAYPIGGDYLDYRDHTHNSVDIRRTEIQGSYNDDSQFRLSKNLVSFYSPDIEFDDQFQNTDFSGLIYADAGKATIINTWSDISIQTETPTISNTGSGFIHQAFSVSGDKGIVSGLFYEDFAVDDFADKSLGLWDKQKSPYKWLVYPWHKSGSLNNDINRPANQGTASAVLKKKIISHLRYCTSNISNYNHTDRDITAKLFNSRQATIEKIGGKIYSGNVDTVLIPDNFDGVYCAFNNSNDDSFKQPNITTPFTQPIMWKTYAETEQNTDKHGMYKYSGSLWSLASGDNENLGTDYIDLVLKKEPVRMKYKSCPHMVLYDSSNSPWGLTENSNIKIIDLVRDTQGSDYPSADLDILQACNWVPCGKPVSITSGTTTIYYSYGDTYYQRYDCLKTYPFTHEDPNQIVEIGSFMLESRVNIDGRYDKNRGQASNLYMTPENFNLLNPVYSQQDNFFTYKILPHDAQESQQYPNQLTWTKTKTSGADVELWTNITLASSLELDGDKGRLRKLVRLDNQLIAFQDTGISRILYDENVQISTESGVPIELGNSGKVQGKLYLSNTIGCSNKWSIVNTPSGIYFMDNNDKGIYLFNGQLQSLSNSKGFNSWCKNNIFAVNPWNPVDFNNFVTYYDRQNQDVLFINNTTALAFSEKLGNFTSFYDYGGAPYFCNLDDIGLWLIGIIGQTTNTEIWKHRGGDYCSFFGVNKPYSMTLVGNPEPQLDKIFTNLEFRASVDGDVKAVVEQQTVVDSQASNAPAIGDNPNPLEPAVTTDTTYVPLLPFDYLETWDEYQHGIASLQNKNGHAAMQHHLQDTNKTAALKRKFRIWRCDIPRDNAPVNAETEAAMGIYRKIDAPHPIDRMRNPWIHLKLSKNAAAEGSTLSRAEIHDVIMTYFD